MSKWTLFWDMHSGGGTKEKPYEKIYIEAPRVEAIAIFYNRFGHNPERVSCTCCGEDYSISEEDSFLQASGYHRNCKLADGGYIEAPDRKDSRRYLTEEEYTAQPDVLVIRASEIKPEERRGDVPERGYVWAG